MAGGNLVPGFGDLQQNWIFRWYSSVIGFHRVLQMSNELSTYLQREPLTNLAKKLTTAAWIVTSAVLVLVAAMGRIKIELPTGVDFAWLPPVYSTLNALCAVSLIAAVMFIKAGRVGLHRLAILVAMAFSGLFLLGYVAYHMTSDPTSYGGEGAMKTVYYFLLITHIVLAAFSLPFILLAFISGHTNHFAKHRKLVKWVFPLWLYVAVTGPIVYLMLRPFYG